MTDNKIDDKPYPINILLMFRYKMSNFYISKFQDHEKDITIYQPAATG